MRRFHRFVLLAALLNCFLLPALPQEPKPEASPLVSCTCKRPTNKKRPPTPPRPHPSAFNLNVQLGQAESASPKQGCTPDEKASFADLAEAKDQFDDGKFADAAKSYQDLLTSCNDKTKDAAIAGYALSREKMRSWQWWWWQRTDWKRDNQPSWLPWPKLPSLVSWLRFPFLHSLLFLTLCLILVALLFAFSDRRPVRVPLSWCRRRLESIFMPPFLGRAAIIDPIDLGKEAQVALFAASLQSNARLARELMSGDQVHLQVRSSTLLSIPSALGRSIFEDVPEIGGVKLGGIAQFLLGAGRYLGWRVETHLAFYPSATAGESARMLAVSTLCWAWFSDAPIRIEREVRDAQDVDDIAFAIAARILGRYFVSPKS